jgi:RNA polymerase sigma-70 factor (ECF subfamily)
MEINIEQVTSAARRGEKQAAEQLIEFFYRRIFAFLRRLAGNDADAADLTQRTFARVWQALPSFAARSTVGSWIHGIAYHVYVDWCRANRRTEAKSDEWWAVQPDSDAPPDVVLLRNDMAARVYACVDHLEPVCRETVHLHYYQELTLQETADAMGVAASTVKYRLRTALTELQKQLETPGSFRSASIADISTVTPSVRSSK